MTFPKPVPEYERTEYLGMVTPTELRNLAEALENSNHNGEQIARRFYVSLTMLKALEVVSDLLEFHDGSAEKLTEQGQPVIWINASSPDGDFQTMLEAVRAALKAATGHSNPGAVAALRATFAAPFKPGDRVRIKKNDHLGDHIVDGCEWYEPGPGGAEPYWLCHCTEIRDPVDWSKIKPGATGIVTYSRWKGSADHLELAP